MEPWDKRGVSRRGNCVPVRVQPPGQRDQPEFAGYAVFYPFCPVPNCGSWHAFLCSMPSLLQVVGRRLTQNVVSDDLLQNDVALVPYWLTRSRIFCTMAAWSMFGTDLSGQLVVIRLARYQEKYAQL